MHVTFLLHTGYKSFLPAFLLAVFFVDFSLLGIEQIKMQHLTFNDKIYGNNYVIINLPPRICR